MQQPGIIRRGFATLMGAISWLRLVLLNVLFVVILVAVFIALSGSRLPTIPDNGALLLDIEGQLVDQLSYTDPMAILLGAGNSGQAETLLQDVIDAVHFAAEDPRINTLVLRLDKLSRGGISKFQEIAPALEQFRGAGKKIIALGDNFNQDQYWLAAQADEVYVNPFGGVSLQGYAVYRNYYKSALDRLKINVHVFRVGEFKSAMEPFMRDDMSAAARSSNLLWLQSLWSQYSTTIAAKRALSVQDIDLYVEQYDRLLAANGGDNAATALAQGLVDGIKSRDQMAAYLRAQVGAVDDNGAYARVGFKQYLWLKNLETVRLQDVPAVAVITAKGNIVDGEQGAGVIGGDSLALLIQRARDDSSVKSVVLRIDSGGGSVFASEIIRRELELLKDGGKPLVVSMGSMAASGGYWIAALADEIWATPTTLTGSIGIFGAIPTFDQSLSSLGISSDGVATHAAGSARIDRPLPPSAGRAIQASIEFGYRRFIDIVASGRKMETEAVEAIAGGRVWTGADALEIGLVDQLGSLDQAITAAAGLAKLDSFKVKTIEQAISPQQQLLIELMSNALVSSTVEQLTGTTLGLPVQSLISPLIDSVDFLSSMNDPRGAYMYCSACLAP